MIPSTKQVLEVIGLLFAGTFPVGETARKALPGKTSEAIKAGRHPQANETANNRLQEQDAAKLLDKLDNLSVENDSTSFPWVLKCKAGTGERDSPNIFVSPSGEDSKDKHRGMSREAPYKTLAFAVSRREYHRKPATGNCVTVNLMTGTYKNFDFGAHGGGSEFILKMDGVQEVIIKNDDPATGAKQAARVKLEFDGPGGLVGGSEMKPASDLEIYGFEICGPNEKITYNDAIKDRLIGSNLYKGQGVGIWWGYRIYFHNMTVHHTPGAGLRVNNGDYLVVESSVVFGTTWWSRSAESAIVFAQARHIDSDTKIKIIMRNNKVYDNMNKIPYFNPNYAYDYFPIGKKFCKEDEALATCKTLYACCNKDDQSCCNNASMKYACPWQCRYGKASQDYVIDGQGVYVTRNSDTYLFGQMALIGNVAYNNGINGLVFHRTFNGLVKNNFVWNNGQIPADGHPETLLCTKPQDSDCWKIPLSKGLNPDKPKTGRQPYSGLTLSNAKNVRLWSNVVKARYSDDKAYEFEIDDGSTYSLQAGGNNVDCQGKLNQLVEKYVKTYEPGTRSYEKYCTNETFDALK